MSNVYNWHVLPVAPTDSPFGGGQRLVSPEMAAKSIRLEFVRRNLDPLFGLRI